MSLFSKVLNRIPRPTAKHVVVGAVYALLLAGSIGLGVAARQSTSAAVIRDCGGSTHNSIDYQPINGGCGAADANEFIADVQQNNPSDLQTIYNHFGLTPDKYNRFKSTAQSGMALQNGNIVVNGQIVMTNAWSIGRDKFSYSSNYPIAGAGATYSSPHTRVLKQDLPVMVMFDAQGNVEFYVINACGNPGSGNNVPSSVTCNALNSTQDSKNPNLYSFTTSANVTGNATITRAVYHFSDGTPDVTTTDLSKQISHTFTKDTDVTVTVYAKVPGGSEISAAVGNCKKHVTFKTPIFACTLLTATMPDPKDKHTFRFTVTTSQEAGVTPKSADFTLDGTVTTTGVTTKDNGNFFKEYTFADEKEHTVKVSVAFDTFNGVMVASSDKCVAKATGEKIPPCTVNPNLPECQPPKECKPGIPENDSRCNPPEECKPGVLKGSAECNPPVLTNTGPGNITGLFAGTSVLGALGHSFYARKRRAARA